MPAFCEVAKMFYGIENNKEIGQFEDAHHLYGNPSLMSSLSLILQ